MTGMPEAPRRVDTVDLLHHVEPCDMNGTHYRSALAMLWLCTSLELSMFLLVFERYVSPPTCPTAFCTPQGACRASSYHVQHHPSSPNSLPRFPGQAWNFSTRYPYSKRYGKRYGSKRYSERYCKRYSERSRGEGKGPCSPT